MLVVRKLVEDLGISPGECSQRSSPSVLKEDRCGRCHFALFAHFPNLPCHPALRTRGPAVLSSTSAVLRHPHIVPGVQVIRADSLFPTIIYIVLCKHWYCACCRVFGLLPGGFQFTTITQSGLIELEGRNATESLSQMQGVISLLWLISLKTFPIAVSFTQEIRNPGVEFRASLSF